MYPLMVLRVDCTSGWAGVLIEYVGGEEPRGSARASTLVSCNLINVCGFVRRIPILVRCVHV